jgi:hypothetical protein
VPYEYFLFAGGVCAATQRIRIAWKEISFFIIGILFPITLRTAQQSEIVSQSELLGRQFDAETTVPALTVSTAFVGSEASSFAVEFAADLLLIPELSVLLRSAGQPFSALSPSIGPFESGTTANEK